MYKFLSFIYLIVWHDDAILNLLKVVEQVVVILRNIMVPACGFSSLINTIINISWTVFIL